jgi:hypothetical protein
MNDQEQLAELERELAGCHEHGAYEYEHLAETLDQRAAQEERAGHDPTSFRLAARRLRATGQRYREAHQCQAS